MTKLEERNNMTTEPRQSQLEETAGKSDDKREITAFWGEGGARRKRG